MGSWVLRESLKGHGDEKPFLALLQGYCQTSADNDNTNEHLLCYRAKIHSLHLGINLQAFSLKQGYQKDLKIEFFCYKTLFSRFEFF